MWDDPTASTTQSISVNPEITTTYTVTVTSGVCSGTDQVTVTVFPNPNVDAGPDVTLCIGETVQFSTQARIGYTSENFSYINSFTPDWSPAGPEFLFNSVDDDSYSTIFRVRRSQAGQNWGIAYKLGSVFTIDAISLDLSLIHI